MTLSDIMIVVSAALNVAVLAAVTVSFAADAEWIRSAYGDRTPARDILLSIYIAVLIASIALVIGLASGTWWTRGAAVGLLTAQILYKLLTAILVRRALRNPVVLSNLGIAFVHTVTVIAVLVGGGP